MRSLLAVGRFRCRIPAVLVAVVLLLTSAVSASAQGLESMANPELDRELAYADALFREGLADFMDILVAKLEKRWPEAKARFEVLKIKGLIAQAKFDEVKRIIGAKPNQKSQEVWAMKLALADGFYAWGRYAEAEGIYNSFFQAYPDGPTAALKQFYLESAYKFAQMLLLMGREDAALKAYNNALKSKPEKYITRQIQGEMSEVLIKLAENSEGEQRAKYFKRIEKLNNEILWQQDIWFGKAIVIMAHMNMMEGKFEEAMKLIDDYRAQLLGIDQQLKEQRDRGGEDLTRLSPMAQCRYLLGVMLHDEAKKILKKEGGNREKAKLLLAGRPVTGADGKKKRTGGAIHHFLNVFIGYPNTTWAPDAGVRAKEVEELLVREYGAKINTKVTPERMETVRKAQFQEARSLFFQNRFGDAIVSYLKVLNLFPEGPTSVSAVGELATCYLQEKDELHFDMVTGYLAERFGRNEEVRITAGDRLLGLAAKLSELEMRDKEQRVYNLFFNHVSGHPRAADTLFRFGEENFRDERFDEALGYFQRVATNYPDAKIWDSAMNRIAACYNKQEKYVQEIKTLQSLGGKLKDLERPGHTYVSTKFREGYAYKKLGGKYISTAINRFHEVVELLSGDDSAYHSTPQEKETNASILEGALFYKGLCYSLLSEPAAKVATYQDQAITDLQALVAKFPKSKFAPAALSQVGTILTIQEKPDEARKVLKDLQDKYPDSPEAKNALFVLGKNLLELGRRQEATRIFKQMFEGNVQYRPDQFLTAGTELAKAGESEIALQAFDKVLSGTDKDSLIQRALLGKGAALRAQKRLPEAAEALAQVMTRFAESKATIDAATDLSIIYAEMGKEEEDAGKRTGLFNRAVEAVEHVRKFANSAKDKTRADLEVARLQRRRAEAEKTYGDDPERLRETHGAAAATYQRIVLFGDPNDAEVRPYIEDAYVEGLPLLFEIEKWQDVLDTASDYEKNFPNGRHALVVKEWQGKARIKQITSGATGSGTEPGAEGGTDQEKE